MCDPQRRPRCTRHIATQGAILSLNDEEVQGVIPAICRFLHIEWCHMATHHPLYFLYCEAQLGRRNGTECVPVFVCVCVCTHVVPVICWWFTQLSGSHPGPIFSFSLHNSKRYYRCLVSCPFFSSSPSPFCFSATSCSFSPLSSTLLCVGDVTARHSLVLLYHPWDREVTGPEHTI